MYESGRLLLTFCTNRMRETSIDRQNNNNNTRGGTVQCIDERRGPSYNSKNMIVEDLRRITVYTKRPS